MHYFIDGYNLLFYLFGASVHDFQARREKLIQELNLEIEFLSLDVTLVFDSHFAPGEGSRSHFRHLEILFTPEGISADDLIIQKLSHSRDARKEVVVTNDKKLALRARQHLASSQSLENFLNWLTRRYSNKKRNKVKPIGLLKKASSSNLPPSPSKAENLEEPPQMPIKPQEKIVEGSLEYYLETFEAAHEALIQEEQAAKKARKLRNKANRKK